MLIPKHGFLALLLIFIVTEAYSQEYLVLEKMGTKKRHEYFSGEEIIFKLKDEGFFRKDEILGLGDSTILFESGSVPLNDIYKVSLANRKVAMKGVGSTLIVAGLGYMIIDLFNKTITEGDIYFDEKVARSAGIIAGAGFLLVAISKKRVNLRRNWRLRIVDL